MSVSKCFSFQQDEKKKDGRGKEERLSILKELKSENDLMIMYEDLTLNKKLSDSSSLYLILSPESANSVVSSATCIQISHYANCWKDIWDLEPASSQTKLHGLKISAKAKNYFMNGLPTHLVPTAELDTLFCDEPTMIYRNREDTKNKLCQITSPNEVVQAYRNVAMTDTTERPCCCLPKPQKDVHYTYPRSFGNVKPHSRNGLTAGCRYPTCRGPPGCFSPPRHQQMQIDHGVNYEYMQKRKNCHTPSCRGHSNCNSTIVPMSIHIAEGINNGPHNFPTITQPPTTNCKVPKCRAPTCHNPIREKLKTSAVPFPQEKSKVNEQCQFDSNELMTLLDKIDIAMKSVACGGDSKLAEETTANAKIPNKHMDPKSEGSKSECDNCFKASDACGCWSNKKKGEKLRKLCACELNQPVLSKSEKGPREGTSSYGSDVDSLLFSMTVVSLGIQTEPCGSLLLLILGPKGGFSKIKKGGTFTQAGTLDKNCTCKKSEINKSKKVNLDASPPHEIAIPEKPFYIADREDATCNRQCPEQKYLTKLQSDMTQTTSGFRLYKKMKKPSSKNSEDKYTFEDAIMSFAKLNPQMFEDIISPGSSNPCLCDDDKLSNKIAAKLFHRISGKTSSALRQKKSKKDVVCECSYDPDYKSTAERLSDKELNKQNEEAEEGEKDIPLKGFKFTIGGKGSLSKGLAGICCFDVVEERHGSSLSWPTMDIKFSRSTSINLVQTSSSILEYHVMAKQNKLWSSSDLNGGK